MRRSGTFACCLNPFLYLTPHDLFRTTAVPVNPHGICLIFIPLQVLQTLFLVFLLLFVHPQTVTVHGDLGRRGGRSCTGPPALIPPPHAAAVPVPAASLLHPPPPWAFSFSFVATGREGGEWPCPCTGPCCCLVVACQITIGAAYWHGKEWDTPPSRNIRVVWNPSDIVEKRQHCVNDNIC